MTLERVLRDPARANIGDDGEGQSDNGTYEDVAVSVLREELKPNSGLTDEAMQAIEAKHRFVFST